MSHRLVRFHCPTCGKNQHKTHPHRPTDDTRDMLIRFYELTAAPDQVCNACLCAAQRGVHARRKPCNLDSHNRTRSENTNPQPGPIRVSPRKRARFKLIDADADDNVVLGQTMDIRIPVDFDAVRGSDQERKGRGTAQGNAVDLV